MTLFHAPCVRLSASGCAVLALAAALFSDAQAREARRAQRQTVIEEIAPPTRGAFDDIVLQLPPLAPVQRKSQPPAGAALATPSSAPPVAETPVAPTARVSEPEAPPPENTQATAPSVIAPEGRAPQETSAQSAGQGAEAEARPAQGEASAPPSAEAQTAEPPPQGTGAETPKDTAVSQTDSRQDAPAEPSPAEVAAPPSELRLRETTEPGPTEAAPDTSSQPVVSESAPSPQPEAAKPAAEDATANGEAREEGSIFETWQLIVAAFALGGLLFVRRRRVKSAGDKTSEPAPETSPQTAAAPAPKKIGAPLASARTAWTKAAPVVAARFAQLRQLVATLRRRRSENALAGDKPDASAAAPPNAKPQRLSKANWAEIAATLRSKIAAPKPASSDASARERPAAASGVASTPTSAATPPSLDADRWDQADQEVPELLEPGASSTQAIVMNARRKFRAAQG